MSHQLNANDLAALADREGVDPKHRCFVSLLYDGQDMPAYIGPLDYDAARRIMSNLDTNATKVLIDLDDNSITIPGAVIRGDVYAPFYSTLRTLIMAAQNTALLGAGAMGDMDPSSRDDMLSLSRDIDSIRLRIS